MFTGLIQRVGRIETVGRSAQGARIRLSASPHFEDLVQGESIAVNGVCLTVVEIATPSFCVDVSPETLSRTSLSSLGPQAEVNLERALRLTDRLGGHIVTGHVDCVGSIRRKTSDGTFARFEISLPEAHSRYIVEKGSVTVDGISLTVASCTAGLFSVAVIPQTLAATTLRNRKEGDLVNIETDILGKYVEQLLARSKSSGASDERMRRLLAENGFMGA